VFKIKNKKQNIGNNLQVKNVLTDKCLEKNSLERRIEKFVRFAEIPKTDFNSLGFIDPNTVSLIPEEMARQFGITPIDQKDGRISIAMSNPFDPIAIDTIKAITGNKLDISYASYSQILEEIEKVYTQKANIEESMKELVDFEVEEEVEEEDEELLRIQAEDAPAIKFVNLLLLQAIQDRASDIHIEPQEKELKIRLRVDGILREITPPPKRMQPGIISRIKILGNLDIA